MEYERVTPVCRYRKRFYIVTTFAYSALAAANFPVWVEMLADWLRLSATRATPKCHECSQHSQPTVWMKALSLLGIFAAVRGLISQSNLHFELYIEESVVNSCQE